MTRNCLECDQPFEAKRATAKYCSNKCKMIVKNRTDNENTTEDIDSKPVKPAKKIVKEAKAAHDAPTQFLGELRMKKLGF